MEGVNALTGLCLISTASVEFQVKEAIKQCVNALTGLCLISTSKMLVNNEMIYEVSMPSRAYASFLPLIIGIFVVRIYGKGVNALTGLCLISTAVRDAEDQVIMSVNALTGLCLISTSMTMTCV